MSEYSEITVDRIQAFEDKLGVTFQGLFSFIKLEQDEWLLISGELHPLNGTNIEQDIQLVISAHDSENRVIGFTKISIAASSFFGFETFSDHIYNCPKSICKVRIYPKLA